MAEHNNFYIDAPLTNVAARRKPPMFLASRILPELGVSKMTGKFWKLDPEAVALQLQDSSRAPGAEAKPLYSDDPETDDYSVKDHSYSDLLPDELKEQIESPLISETNKIQRMVDALLLEREIKLVSTLESTLTGNSTASPTVKFSDYTTSGDGSDPILYLTNLYDRIEEGIGAAPNFMALDVKVARALVNHPAFQERAKYTLPPSANTNGMAAMEQLLRSVLALDNVYIAFGNLKNVARKKSTKNIQRTWGENILIGYQEPPSLEYAGLGLHFVYQSSDAQSVNGYIVERTRNERRKADEFFIHSYYQQKIINPAAAVLVTNTLSSS